MPESSSRPYHSLRRAAQAEQTQADIAEAARTLFLTHGWGATTIRAVARQAGVSVPTVYAAYGNKAGLARALVDAADFSAGLGDELAQLEAAQGDPAGQLAAMAAYDRRLFERSGDLLLLLRDAGRTEPELEGLYREARHRADEFRHQVFASWPAETLQEPVATAVDIYAALCNADMYRVLTAERGWSADRVQHWWSQVLARELLR